MKKRQRMCKLHKYLQMCNPLCGCVEVCLIQKIYYQEVTKNCVTQSLLIPIERVKDKTKLKLNFHTLYQMKHLKRG